MREGPQPNAPRQTAQISPPETRRLVRGDGSAGTENVYEATITILEVPTTGPVQVDGARTRHTYDGTPVRWSLLDQYVTLDTDRDALAAAARIDRADLDDYLAGDIPDDRIRRRLAAALPGAPDPAEVWPLELRPVTPTPAVVAPHTVAPRRGDPNAAAKIRDAQARRAENRRRIDRARDVINAVFDRADEAEGRAVLTRTRAKLDGKAMSSPTRSRWQTGDEVAAAVAIGGEAVREQAYREGWALHFDRTGSRWVFEG